MPASRDRLPTTADVLLGGHRRVRFLASVRSVEEARVAVAAGADIIDAKEPAHGALGAVASAIIAAMRRAIPATTPLSATIGDIPCEATDRIVDTIAEIDAAGADLIKIGLFPPTGIRRDRDADALLSALASAPQAFGRRVLVMLADRGLDLAIVPRLPAAGFAGVMLDTADKSSGALPDVLDTETIARFVFTARQARLSVGLAGALRLWHIQTLVRLDPDILGFRGALCGGQSRTSEIDPEAAADVAKAIDRSLAAANAA